MLKNFLDVATAWNTATGRRGAPAGQGAHDERRNAFARVH
jgi:hypothetical protein